MTPGFDYQKIPAKRIAAGLMLMSADHRFVMVKPAYRPEWLLPGGIVERNESPLEACRREVVEELGLVPDIMGLAGTSWKPGYDDRPEAIHFVFFSRISAEEIAGLKSREAEITDVQLFTLEEAISRAGAVQGRRLKSCHEAILSGRTAYIDLI